MALVADTSPLNYLIQIGAINLLPVLYGTVHIPNVVLAELSDPEAPASVQEWVSMPPPWLFVQHVSIDPVADDPIDVGERAAIQLALRFGCDKNRIGRCCSTCGGRGKEIACHRHHWRPGSSGRPGAHRIHVRISRPFTNELSYVRSAPKSCVGETPHTGL